MASPCLSAKIWCRAVWNFQSFAEWCSWNWSENHQYPKWTNSTPFWTSAVLNDMKTEHLRTGIQAVVLYAWSWFLCLGGECVVASFLDKSTAFLPKAILTEREAECLWTILARKRKAWRQRCFSKTVQWWSLLDWCAFRNANDRLETSAH